MKKQLAIIFIIFISAFTINAQDTMFVHQTGNVSYFLVNDIDSIVFYGQSSPGNTVIDIDGNVYPIITIGTQEWLGKNLKTTHLNDGTSIFNPTSNYDTILVTPSYVWWDNDISNKPAYGAMYNWHASILDNICPIGWHVPSESEWDILVNLAGGENAAGGKLKEIGTTHWNSPNTGATDEYDFTALPGGSLIGTDFTEFHKRGYHWERNVDGTHHYWRMIKWDNTKVLRWFSSAGTYISIRCIKD
jgi:uncharacterized protein (TIGR02145 family)